MPEIDVYDGKITDYYDAGNRNLLARWNPCRDWLDARLDAGLEPYSKVTTGRISTSLRGTDRRGRPIGGLNFASQDYLSLASDPRVIAAAQAAAGQYGVHSAGSAALMGLCAPTIRLEAEIARFVGLADATVFPTGWGAGYGAIRTLARAGDHIVIDVLAHACLQEAAAASGATVHRFPHASTEGVARRLSRLRADHPAAGILVVTEGIFSMDSDSPDTRALQDLCRAHDATLFLDVAHDLGAIGPGGRGVQELQHMIGAVDVVMGSFSKTFASNGGFVATNSRSLKLALRYGAGPLTFTNSLSPVQASTILTCLDIIDSPEGASRRADLMRNAALLREGLGTEGFDVLGTPSAIVPVILGDSRTSREMTRAMIGLGALVNLVEFPAVARNACRWRLQVMAQHTESQIEQCVALAVRARRSVQRAAAARSFAAG